MAPQFIKLSLGANYPNELSRDVFAKMRFLSGLPMLIFRNHDGGRVKVFRSGAWIATIVPGRLVSLDDECVLLDRAPDGSSDHEFRGSVSYIAGVLSELQQSDGDWHRVDA